MLFKFLLFDEKERKKQVQNILKKKIRNIVYVT